MHELTAHISHFYDTKKMAKIWNLKIFNNYFILLWMPQDLCKTNISQLGYWVDMHSWYFPLYFLDVATPPPPAPRQVMWKRLQKFLKIKLEQRAIELEQHMTSITRLLLRLHLSYEWMWARRKWTRLNLQWFACWYRQCSPCQRSTEGTNHAQVEGSF